MNSFVIENGGLNKIFFKKSIIIQFQILINQLSVAKYNYFLKE